MIILIIFAFVAGLVTILSPCILPILPIVLASSAAGDRKRPLGIVSGFVLSFTFFTLFLSTIVKTTGLPAESLRILSIIIIFTFGLGLLIPAFQLFLEKLFSRLAFLVPSQKGRAGFGGGILMGLSLGLLWTPCVGPILASVISLALAGSVNGTAFVITLAYAVGTAVPMLAVIYGGRRLLQQTPWLVNKTQAIQKTFGVVMIATSIALYLNIDRKFQSYIVERFPQYGVGLTTIEDNQKVQEELGKIQKKPIDPAKRGKPMNDLLDFDQNRAPEFIPGGEWINLPAGKQALTMKELRGKVVLVDFWTYTCINCIRTLPYLRSWNEKYKDQGLVIVGVHTPEFEFEKNPDNVKKAVRDFGLTYPIMQDNDYATWNAYGNRFWPAKYFIDKDGKIRWQHFGEGSYDESEAMIQKLLTETGAEVGGFTINNPTYQIGAQTPESYLGYQRIASLASPEDLQPDQQMRYSIPVKLPLHSFAFGGTWTIGKERAMPNQDSTLVLHFEAKDVFLVMRPTKGMGKVQVFLDDVLVTEKAGEDVASGVVTVDSDRLYKLIRLPVTGNHLLKLEFLDDNLELYAFTFG